MATPEKPSPHKSLHEDLEELESLLAGQERPAAGDNGGGQAPREIPVLDELAGPDDYSKAEPAAASPGRIDPRQLAEIGRRLEQRLESELAELTGVLRGVVKRCILEELRSYVAPAGPRPQGADKTAGGGDSARTATPEKLPGPD